MRVLLLLLAVAACDTLPEAVAPSAPVDPGAVTLVATGTFADRGGQTTRGSYRIERVGTDLRLVLGDDFRTDDGPDLHLVLSPQTTAAVGDGNATAGSRVLDAVQARSGAQVYDLPDDLDMRPFRSVLVHCVRFSHLFGAAPLAVP